MTCTLCRQPIEPERLAVIATDICAACAIANPEPKVLGVLCFNGKTAPSLGVLNPQATEARRLIVNQTRRTRWAG